jgi:hypothetical protein|tara:strand:- start:99 stop:227 length:129 start_codon:yes stop_codon:yes gene_type:complete
MSDIDMRLLYLEKEVEKLREYVQRLEVKLAANPFTRDTFKNE